MAQQPTISLNLSLSDPLHRAALRGLLDAADGITPTEGEPPKRKGRPVAGPKADKPAPAAEPAPEPAGNGSAPAIPAPAAPDLPASPDEMTMEKLREAMTAFVRAKGTAHGIQLLKSFGVERVANLPKEKWQEFYDKVVAS